MNIKQYWMAPVLALAIIQGVQADNIIRVSVPLSGQRSGSVVTPPDESPSTLSLAAATLTKANVGKEASYRFSPYVGNPNNLPLTWSLVGNAPAGLSFSSAGILTGVPTVAGTSLITVKVSSGRQSAQREYSLTTLEAVSLSLSDSTLIDGMVGFPYSHDFAPMAQWANLGEEPVPALFWESTNSLPTGLVLSEDGVLSGTPTQTGSRSFEIVGSYGEYSANKIYTLTIGDAVFKAKAITSGGNHTCAISTDNSAYCWGKNAFGQLGDGTTVSSTRPKLVSGLQGNVQKLEAGQDHTCAIITGGVAKCWGNGGSGRLGNGLGSNSSIPVTVSGNHVFTHLSIGNDNTCGVTDIGAALCWGNNGLGKLGDGTSNNRSTPVQVTGLNSGVLQTATSYYATSCAIMSSGKTYCWGGGDVGQLGNGANGNSSAPVMANLPAGVSLTNITGGNKNFCGVGSNNIAYCWGEGGNGEIGDGRTVSVNVPTAVINYGFKAISIGRYKHNCGVTTANKAVCWANNSVYQAGTVNGSYVPQPVVSIGDVSAISAGYWHSCAIEVNGTVKCWGASTDGRLGNTTASGNVMTPVSVQTPVTP